MAAPIPLTILCLASYEKGHDFLREAKRQGCRVFLITSLSLKDAAEWPRESIDDIFYMPDHDKSWNRNDTLLAISHLARTHVIDRVVALDDFDLEMAASIREHLRVPGMGETTTRYFRDKLAMRMKAMEAGLKVPEFVHLLNDEKVRQFTESVPPPWVLKPRMMAGAIGIQVVKSTDELRSADWALGDQRSFFLVERFVAGDVCHVDSIVYENEIVFAVASQYGYPPLDVSHRGGIFTTRLLERGSPEAEALLAKNQRVLAAMGLLRGVSHTEFIRGDDGNLYFLETSARVGGAHIAELVEAATDLNLWGEWARVEIAGGKLPYAPPPPKNDYAALLVSLARQEHPDTSAFTDPEIVWRMQRPHHVGMIVKSARRERVAELLDQYVERVKRDFHTVAPPRDKPTS
ncbi:MAG: ATP-grasp domain-containing protein [Bryobacteraceae bacterium]|jgi:biotin carboxylase